MAIEFKVGTHRNCTLYTRHEYRGNAFSDEARAGRQLITSASAGELTHDTRQLAQLVTFMRNAPGCAYVSGATPAQLARMLRTTVERGDVIAVAAKPHASGGRSVRIEQPPRPYHETFSPSQLFRPEQSVARTARSFERPRLPRLPWEDDLAIWFARPGDVLPDGTIAIPVSTPLSNAQPFEYSKAVPVENTEQDAGVFLSPEEEAECELQLNVDIDECSVWYVAKPLSWGVCHERAMQRYANCLRGRD
ncbi:hypothetical protein F3J20_17600 [Paraburkholderia sp. Cy-641]|uniref:hypothetical protein n=1 Tax=Paraburkholderia sp. Cy-641 TaxID=2608337 RepID=UPI001423A700|nr:hypothetical protein [Paraburkholderia sp. Cy-641]NIF79181.1 hypothetical protein [Paraburkholderia sp. Cy-641]